MHDFDIQRDMQINASIEEIRKFIYILNTYKDQQSNNADKLFYEKIIEELSMAIFELGVQKEEKQVSFV